MEEIIENQIAAAIDKFNEKSICKENADSVIRELSPCMDFMERLYIEDIGDLCSKLSMGYYYSGDNGMAIATINKGITQIEETYQKYDESSKKNFLKRYYYQMSELYFKKGWYCSLTAIPKEEKEKEVGAAFRSHVYYGMLNCALSSHNFDFYAFYPTKDYHIDDLKNYRISLSNPSTFNDPVDCPIFKWLEQQIKTGIHSMIVELTKSAYSDIRIRCFVRNTPFLSLEELHPKPLSIEEYGNMLMWSHYADSHRGYCVKYRLPQEFFNTANENSPVLFLAPVSYGSAMNVLKSNLSVQEGLFSKHKCWEYEHEMRLIYFDKDETPDSYHKESMLDGMITDVYFGVRCEDCYKRRIIEALKGRTVKYHQMEIDPKDLYRLKAVPLDSDKIKGLYSRLADLQTCWDELMSIKDTEPAE